MLQCNYITFCFSSYGPLLFGLFLFGEINLKSELPYFALPLTWFSGSNTMNLSPDTVALLGFFFFGVVVLVRWLEVRRRGFVVFCCHLGKSFSQGLTESVY